MTMSKTADDRSMGSVHPDGERYPFPDKLEGGWYFLEIPARIDAVGPLCAFLTLMAERHDLTAEEIHCVEICAYETCLNVIEHAYHFDPSGRIVLRARVDKKRVVLSFYDRGEGADPARIPPPNMTDPKTRLKGRGFGLQIIRKSMDTVKYRRTPNGENNLLMIKKLNRSDPAERDDGVSAWP